MSIRQTMAAQIHGVANELGVSNGTWAKVAAKLRGLASECESKGEAEDEVARAAEAESRAALEETVEEVAPALKTSRFNLFGERES